MNLYKQNFILAASLILSADAALPQAAPATESGAQQERHGRAHKGGMNRLSEALNLTDAQKEQVKAIREKYRASAERQQMRDLHRQLREAKEANNTAEVERLKGERAALVAKAKESWDAERNELRSILNADQQAKLDQMRDKYKKRTE